MSLGTFLKDKALFLFFQGLLMIFLASLLNLMKIGEFAVGLTVFSVALITLIPLTLEFFKKRNFYNQLYESLEIMRQRELVSNIIETPDFEEGRILEDVLKLVSKSMNDQISVYRNSQDEYRDYVETWIHEIKLPISCIDLVCKNNVSEVTKSILDEVSRIDGFVEQALYYARSTNLEKDYVIRKIELESIVKTAIKKHSKQLIQNKAEIRIHNLGFVVFSDLKWLDFILGQIISNCIKYKKDNIILDFSADENDDKVVFAISDDGIGISDKDISRVFDKGFTGENGRNFAKSTGIGLYLCKKLCDKMNLGITLKSQYGVGTTVSISFPKNKGIFFES